jgi:hypothetical protein
MSADATPVERRRVGESLGTPTKSPRKSQGAPRLDSATSSSPSVELHDQAHSVDRPSVAVQHGDQPPHLGVLPQDLAAPRTQQQQVHNGMYTPSPAKRLAIDTLHV